RVTQHGTPEKITPNHFLTLNATPSGGEYAERDLTIDENGNPVDWSDNDGFIISFHYQITRDGVNTTPRNNPVIAIELFEEGATMPIIRITTIHYVEARFNDISLLSPEVDWNRDADFDEDDEVPDTQ